MIDNGSKDGSIDFVRSKVPEEKLRIVRNQSNLGFPRAVDQGVKGSAGKFLFIINNDTVLDKMCIRNLVDRIRNYQESEKRIIGLAPKILFSGRPIIDSVGNGMNPDGAVFNIGIGQVDLGQFDTPRRVFGLCFAAAFIESSAYRKVGSLDGSYFAYFEDIDWCYRANVLGYEFRTTPEAIVQHAHAASARQFLTGDQKYYLIHRNLMRTLIKNYSPTHLKRPIREIFFYGYHAWQDFAAGRYAKSRVQFKIVGSTLLWSPILLAKNLHINLKRVESDETIWKLAADKIYQISGYTFHPETYSVGLSLFALEVMLQHLAMSDADYLRPYFGVYAINYLRHAGSITVPSTTRARRRSPDNHGMRVATFVTSRVSGELIIHNGSRSYWADEFMVNLLNAMNGRTLKEVSEILLPEKLSRNTENMRALVDIILPGLRAIADYLEKIGLVALET